MAKDFTENLVHLSDFRFRADARSELGFNHGERCLDVRPLVVVRQELLTAIHEQTEHFRPKSASALRVKTVGFRSGRVFLKRNVSRRSVSIGESEDS